MNEILKSLHARKSVRVFTQRDIAREEKESILEAALQAPSAGCQLLYTILDITDQRVKENLALLCDDQPFMAAQSLGIGSCYIGDVMENAEKMKALLQLPQYVYPACMLVFGYPTKQQEEREKQKRFQVSDIVCENSYRDKNSRQIREMFQGKTGMKDYEDWMEAFWKRKYESDFSREMNRSMREYLKEYERGNLREV